MKGGKPSLFVMFSDVAITAGGILPFYLAALGVMTRPVQTPYLRLLGLFLMAGLTTVPFFSLRALGVDQSLLSSLIGPLLSIISLAFAEEFVKSVALFFDKELKKHYQYPIIVGLGFAFFENVSYLMGFQLEIAFLVIAFFRLFLLSTAHAVFTTLVAHFMKKGLHRSKSLYYLLGLIVAGSAHSLFNLLHHWEMSYLIVPLLIILILFLHYDEPAQETHRKVARVRYGRLAHSHH